MLVNSVAVILMIQRPVCVPSLSTYEAQKDTIGRLFLSPARIALVRWFVLTRTFSAQKVIHLSSTQWHQPARTSDFRWFARRALICWQVLGKGERSGAFCHELRGSLARLAFLPMADMDWSRSGSWRSRDCRARRGRGRIPPLIDHHLNGPPALPQ
jgi:hypothetical protein